MTAAEEDEGPSACMTPDVWFHLGGAAGGSRYATKGCKVQTPIVSSTPPHHKVSSDCRDDIITLTTSFLRRQLHLLRVQ